MPRAERVDAGEPASGANAPRRAPSSSAPIRESAAATVSRKPVSQISTRLVLDPRDRDLDRLVKRERRRLFGAARRRACAHPVGDLLQVGERLVGLLRRRNRRRFAPRGAPRRALSPT